MIGLSMKRILKSSLALTLAVSLTACTGTDVSDQADASNQANESKQSAETANAGQTEIQNEDVTAAQHGDAVDYLVSKKVELPAQYAYPKEEDFKTSDGEFDYEAYDKAMEEWITNNEARQAISDETIQKLFEYYKKTVPYFLQYKEGENILYSPVNVYMALGMLCEITAGDSRQQILDLLGEKDIESLRESVSQIWNSSYVDDGSVTSILAASLWMNQDIEFNQETVDQLADTYFAESYKGETGSDGMNQALHKWLNDHTGNLLEEQAGAVNLEPETILALATTIYFKAGWADQFNKEANTTETFHAVSGDVEKEFMHSSDTDTFYWGDHFTAVNRELANSGSILFILPEEGTRPQDLLSDQETMDFITNTYDWEKSKNAMIHENIPKFDVDSMTDLVDSLKALGIQDAFDPFKADFTPIVSNQEAMVSSAQHAVRVKVDEEGVEAAAFTVIMAKGTAMLETETVDFTLDRPFLFVIKGSNNLPLFTGIVEKP